MSESDSSQYRDPPARLTIDLRKALQAKTHYHVTVLFKEVLSMFEQLAEEHDEALDKIYEVLPPDYKPYVDLADHFTEEKGKRIRKAVLQRGNDCIRALQDEIEKYEIDFRQPPQP